MFCDSTSDHGVGLMMYSPLTSQTSLCINENSGIIGRKCLIVNEKLRLRILTIVLRPRLRCKLWILQIYFVLYIKI